MPAATSSKPTQGCTVTIVYQLAHQGLGMGLELRPDCDT